MGVNVDQVIFIIFIMGGILAGIAGMLFGMKYTVYPQNRKYQQQKHL